jgi:AcrR family transcriptional regulator
MKVRTDAKRDAILEVARRAFLEMGYERTSMAEIAARLGGSKATLYGYFPSKQELFVAITSQLAEQYLASARARLEESTDEAPGLALQHFGEQLLAFLCTPEAMASFRMVQSEVSNSDIGRSFYEQGPARATAELSTYISGAMGRGQLRRADATAAAQHFLALVVHGEYSRHFFIPDLPKPTRAQIKRTVERALDVFLGGYKA